jgi:hypothetical protein
LTWPEASKEAIARRKKPKKEKIKTIAAAPSQKGAATEPNTRVRQKEIEMARGI